MVRHNHRCKLFFCSDLRQSEKTPQFLHRAPIGAVLLVGEFRPDTVQIWSKCDRFGAHTENGRRDRAAPTAATLFAIISNSRNISTVVCCVVKIIWNEYLNVKRLSVRPLALPIRCRRVEYLVFSRMTQWKRTRRRGRRPDLLSWQRNLHFLWPSLHFLTTIYGLFRLVAPVLRVHRFSIVAESRWLREAHLCEVCNCWGCLIVVVIKSLAFHLFAIVTIRSLASDVSCVCGWAAYTAQSTIFR